MSRDIIYLLKNDLPKGGRELRYSLRSLSNIPHGRVWFLGGMPEWAVNVAHIPFKPSGDKWTDLAEKFKTIAKLDMLPNELIHFDDDMYVMKKMHDIPFYTTGTMDHMYALSAYQPRNSFFPYVKRTKELLEAQGFEKPLMASIHSPLVFERDMIPTHIDDGNGPYEWRSIYYNYALKNGKKMVPMMGDAKAKTETDITNIMMRGQGFLSSLDETFSISKIEVLLAQTFPERSPYEK